MKTDKPDIFLTIKDVNGKSEWQMAVGSTSYPKGPDKYEKLKVKKGDDAQFTFSIKTKDIKFASDHPIEISLAPGQPGPGDPGQFTWTPGGTDTLTVTNPNKDQYLTEYYYKLNFDNATPLDPIIQNGCCQRSDGGGGFHMLSGPGLIGLALLAAAAIALLVLRSRRNRAQG